jgi:hypothetical protein
VTVEAPNNAKKPAKRENGTSVKVSPR